MDLFCVGEILVDLLALEPGPLTAAQSFRRFRGGSVTQVAANAALLGLQVGLAAAIGADPLGDFLRADLTACGVHCEGLQQISTARTSIVFVSHSPDDPDFLPYHDAHRLLQAAALPWDQLKSARAFHTSAFALTAEPIREAALQALTTAREQGALCTFELNYHPHLWNDAAEGHQLVTRALSQVDLVKASHDEARTFFAADQPAEALLARCHELGPRLVVITDGANGAWISEKGNVTHLPAQPVQAVDATGAGDAFSAGLLHGLLNGLAPVEAAQRGIALSARKIARFGPFDKPL